VWYKTVLSWKRCVKSKVWSWNACPEAWIEQLQQMLCVIGLVLWNKKFSWKTYQVSLVHINNASCCKWTGFVKQQKTVTNHKLLQLNCHTVQSSLCTTNSQTTVPKWTNIQRDCVHKKNTLYYDLHTVNIPCSCKQGLGPQMLSSSSSSSPYSLIQQTLKLQLLLQYGIWVWI